MIGRFKRFLQGIGWDVIRSGPDFSSRDRAIIRDVRPFTMSSPERLYALIQATRHIVRRGIPGALVECGVWRGGSVMAMARVLLEEEAADRVLYLYDTFAGMPQPTERDRPLFGRWGNRAQTKLYRSPFYLASPAEVESALLEAGYPKSGIHIVVGRVEETMPRTIPDQISLLRLDTDFYESTKHELMHLFPRLSQGGVLIIDDYGYWQGQRLAVDEYLDAHGIRMLLSRIDFSGRIGIKA